MKNHQGYALVCGAEEPIIKSKAMPDDKKLTRKFTKEDHEVFLAHPNQFKRE